MYCFGYIALSPITICLLDKRYVFVWPLYSRSLALSVGCGPRNFLFILKFIVVYICTTWWWLFTVVPANDVTTLAYFSPQLNLWCWLWWWWWYSCDVFRLIIDNSLTHPSVRAANIYKKRQKPFPFGVVRWRRRQQQSDKIDNKI